MVVKPAAENRVEGQDASSAPALGDPAVPCGSSVNCAMHSLVMLTGNPLICQRDQGKVLATSLMTLVMEEGVPSVSS